MGFLKKTHTNFVIFYIGLVGAKGWQGEPGKQGVPGNVGAPGLRGLDGNVQYRLINILKILVKLIVIIKNIHFVIIYHVTQ